MPPEKAVVESYLIPTTAKVNEYVNISIVGHATTQINNFAIAFYYVDGPAPNLIVNYEGRDYIIEKGMSFTLYLSGTSNACTRITMNAKVKYTLAGTYTVAAIAGYLKENMFYYTDRKDVTVRVEEVKVYTPIILAILASTPLIAAGLILAIRKMTR